MRITPSIVLLGIVLASPAMVLATDLQQFQNLVKKSAPLNLDPTPPVACVCKDGSANQNNLGQLLQGLSGTVSGVQTVPVARLVLGFDNGNFPLSICETGISPEALVVPATSCA